MEKYQFSKTLFLAGALAGLLAIGACTENDVADLDPNGGPNDTTNVDKKPDNEVEENLEADQISAGFILENALTHKGDIPGPSNKADLKIDKDSLFFVEGIKNRLRILKPETFSGFISSILVKVDGAGDFFEVETVAEENTDSIVVIYMEFEPDVDWHLPLSFKVKIAPLDDDGTPIEIVEIDAVVEKKGAGTCSPLNPSSDWFWVWTMTDGVITSAPGMPVGASGTTNGCCMEGYSVDCISNGIPEKDWISMAYESYSMGNLEYISFKEDGSFLGELIEETQNLDYSESNFCEGDPSYIHRTNTNVFWGEYAYESASGELLITSVETAEHEIYLDGLDIFVYDYDKTYILPEAEYEIISCHYLIQRKGVEGSVMERLFERVKRVDFGEITYWYD